MTYYQKEFNARFVHEILCYCISLLSICFVCVPQLPSMDVIVWQAAGVVVVV